MAKEFSTSTFLHTKAMLIVEPECALKILVVLVELEDVNGVVFQMATGTLAAAGTPRITGGTRAWGPAFRRTAKDVQHCDWTGGSG